jgi:uncharacterized protein (TIGR02646 family)
MKYIEKSGEPRSLTNLKMLNYPKFKPSFDNLPPTVLNEIIQQLLKDQGYICCYTMDEITPETAELVLFYPHKFFVTKELSYDNMYLALKQPPKLPDNLKMGYTSKGNTVIPNYLADIRCSTYFRYNTLGEMIPTGTFRTVRKCKDNFKKLTPEQQMVMNTIDVLNLNADNLKQQRKAILQQVTELVRKVSKAQIQEVVAKLFKKDKAGKYRRFCEVMIYYLMQV